jgi:enamine deaminase RidA (YjgF/YER057c/UK114 family)
VSTLSSSESVDSHGCSIALRRIEGPQAREIFLSCQPPAALGEANLQAEAVYSAVLSALQAEGGDFGSVVMETIFLRDLRANIEAVREARRRTLGKDRTSSHPYATTEIEQPPINNGACLEVSVHAVLPLKAAPCFDVITTRPNCECAECLRVRGLQIQFAGEARFHAGGLCGAGSNAYEQTHNMFKLAEDLLQQAGMEFSDVMRTWIHLREMERDYGELNRARREFFEARGIDLVPASTAIGGGPIAEIHDLCLGIYAVKGKRAVERTVMTSPTLNEAMQYGADFVRGMKVNEANKEVLLVSGTASIDEAGNTVHIGDFDAQADRMLVNLAALLKGQGATFQDIVSATTYLKHPADAERLREKFRQANFEGFPNVLVVAPVCRPELLCETELIAVLLVTGESQFQAATGS